MIHSTRLGFVSLIVLLALSACGHGGGSEAPRGAEPTTPTEPAKPEAKKNLPFACVAEGAYGSETFDYPADGASSAYESPTKSFRVELTRVGGAVEMNVWGRDGDTQPYQRSPFPFQYRTEEPIKFHYAWRATVTTTGTTEVDPWSVTCDHANLLPKTAAF